jgi:Uma2 family endonuclease
MATLIAAEKSVPYPKTGKKPQRISKARFLRDYANREDGYKYEWNNGILEKTEAMNQQQAFIQAVIMRYFIHTQAFIEGGLFTSETNMDTSPTQLRKPHLAIYTHEQLLRMKGGENQIAPWVAEVVSVSDNINTVNQKLNEYFQAGVQVVWIIFPESQQVYVYTSPEQVQICRGNTVCSAAPAVPDLNIRAEELFT